MARVQVGEIIMRDKDGNFLPNHIPIYRDLPDTGSEKSDVDKSPLPIDDIAELFLPGFMDHYRATHQKRKPSPAYQRLLDTEKELGVAVK